MLPEEPPTFRQPTPAERPWWWRLESASGETVELTGDAASYAEMRFPSQGDAESWVGETYAELADLGVEQVTLFEVDRLVYGPMSLSA
ncbi:hypothetical protein [Nocardioides montaniterrae]